MTAYETLAPIPNKILAAVGGLTLAAGDTVMATAVGTSTSASVAVLSSGWSYRNMILNGEMRVAQRATSIAAINASAYTLDQWQYINTITGAGIITASQSTVVPNSTFANSLKFDVTTADAAIAAGDFYACAQYIEGLQCARISFGTAAAKSLVLSFWVRVDSPSISFPATFTGAFQNSAQNRAWPFTFSVAATATWQQVSVAITGDLTGTWLQTTGIGLRLFIGLACGSTYQGTAGAWTGSDIRGTSAQTNFMGDTSNDFYLTGVQLEVGTSPSPFEFKDPTKYLTECQRHYWKIGPAAASDLFAVAWMETSLAGQATLQLPVVMRATPTMTTTGAASDYKNRNGATIASVVCSAVPSLATALNTALQLTIASTGGLTAGSGGALLAATTAAFLAFTAEL